MEKVKYLILGAGPAGLSFGARLKQLGIDSFLIIEKENTVGGLCRSVMVDGSPFDIGGGHFLDVRRKRVNDFLFNFMSEDEWNIFDRDSRIKLSEGYEIGHPFEANIWQLPEAEQKLYLRSISEAGCNNNLAAPTKFREWIRWKLGDKISDSYMIPYNLKMFSNDLDELGTYWLEKLPNVSYEETLKSCKEHKAYGQQPGHASFYYPKEAGYGELWERLGEYIGKDRILSGTCVCELDVVNRQVKTENGAMVEADTIVTTIPWRTFSQIKGLSDEQLVNISHLKHSGIETRYVSENLETKAHWIYYPDNELPWHRILVRSNFCTDSCGYWLETRMERTALYETYFDGKYSHCQCFTNEYAYPLNTIDKPEIMADLLKTCEEHQVYGLGRWGQHSHFNSDVTVELALDLAERLAF